MKKKNKSCLIHPLDKAGIYLLLCLLFLGLNSPSLLAYGSTESIQMHTVSGTITSSEDGETLPGVNISVKGTTIGTISDVNGRYSIECDNANATLLFSYVGFLGQEVAVNERSVIDVQMTMDTKTFDEVVIVGYGTQKKVSLTGAVDVINNQEIKDRPVSNVSQALQGLAPNLNITTGADGGEMGARLNINIRGMGSINGGEPYVLVDGVEQDLYTLNPSDIESISVLKDASASAIYGARAAFGVILVLTKKGRTDGISVSYSNNYAFSAPTIVPHPVNSLVFAEYFNYGAKNSKIIAPFVPYIIDRMKEYQAGEIDNWTMPYPGNEQVWLSYNGSWANTDWYEETYKKWVPNNTHNLSVSGGNENTQFFISGSVFNQAGLLNYGEDNYSRNNINTKINTKVYDWLRFNFMSKIASINVERPSYERKDFYYSLLRQWPTNAPYYPDGNLAGEAVQIWLERGGMYNEKQNDILVVPGVEIEPLKGWVIYANYRWKYNPGQATNHKALVYGTDAYGLPVLLPGENYFTMGSQENTYNSPNIYSTYNKKFGENDFTIMAGFEQELFTYTSSFATRYDLVTDEIPSLSTATGRDENGGEMGHYSTRSFFGRLNYSYKEKYLFEISGRFDGSSKFPKNYRWGAFPSGSAAYIISKEDFWAPLQRVVNLFKVRASYGSLGNQIVDNYLYVERLPFHTNMSYIIGNERPNYVQMAGLVSPGITWEKVRTSDIGLDAGFLRNRLTLSVDYFIRNTLDMLGPAESYPQVLGTAVPKSNNAELQTKGFELVLEWRDRIQDFSYSAKFMLSDYRTTITKYYNPQRLLSGVFYEGAKEGEIWGYTTVGLFESDEQAQDPNHDQSFLSQKTWQAGDVNYADINNDNKIDRGMNTVDDPGDLSIIGNSAPRYRASALLNFSWKGFDFNMLWQGVAKRDLALDGPLFWGMLGSKWWNIALEEHMDYWTPDNPDAYWPRPYYENWDPVKNHQTQTRYLQNGAYLRLKSVQLGYTLPGNLSQKVKINNLRVFVSGENLITITKLIDVFDPELTGGVYGSGAQYPLQKVISVGLNATF